jgi:predicted CXXCH cytochrome family protein
MKTRGMLIVLAVVSIAVVVTAVYTKRPHEYTDRECFKCHINPENTPERLRGTVTRLCKHCHKKILRNSSHPVGIAPRFTSIPADLPLRDGKLTCVTCHNPHSEKRTLFGSNTYFLRRPNTDMRVFCASCHEEDPQSPGHLITKVAHMGSRYKTTNSSETLDPLSIQCISCHDGTVAKAITSRELGTGTWNHIKDSHPIGVNYNRARMTGNELVAKSRIDRKIRFFGGNIGCGTCHDMYSDLPDKLVMSNVDSTLCLGCHEK